MEEVVVLASSPKPSCKHCHSSRTARGGMAHGKQRYSCKGCKRTFLDNGAAPGMRYPMQVVASALEQFYGAASLHLIVRCLVVRHGVQPEHANIQRWIAKYTNRAAGAVTLMRPQVGSQWIVHETQARTYALGAKQPVWLWDIIDTRTRFLLVTGCSRERGSLDFDALLQAAKQRAGHAPEVLFAEKAILARGDFEIRVPTPFALKVVNSSSGRNSILWRLRSRKALSLSILGWVIHYNFFRSHPGLGGKTPAETAGIHSLFRSWADVVAM